MVTNCATPLVQGGLWCGDILDDRHAVPIYVCSIVYGNTHHSEFVSQTSQFINSYLHGNKLFAEDPSLNCGLLLGVPVKKGYVDIDQEVNAGMSGLFVPCMTHFCISRKCEDFEVLWNHINDFQTKFLSYLH